MTPFSFIYFLSSNCLSYLFLYLKNVKFHFHGVPPFGPFWSARFLNFRELKAVRSKILPGSIQETYKLRRTLLFQSSWEPKLSDLMIYWRRIGKNDSSIWDLHRLFLCNLSHKMYLTFFAYHKKMKIPTKFVLFNL